MDEDFTGIVHVEGLRTGDNREIITKDSFKKDQFPKTVPLKNEEGLVIGTAELSLVGDEINVKGSVDNEWISLLYPPELNPGYGVSNAGMEKSDGETRS